MDQSWDDEAKGGYVQARRSMARDGLYTRYYNIKNAQMISRTHRLYVCDILESWSPARFRPLLPEK